MERRRQSTLRLLNNRADSRQNRRANGTSSFHRRHLGDKLQILARHSPHHVTAVEHLVDEMLRSLKLLAALAALMNVS